MSTSSAPSPQQLRGVLLVGGSLAAVIGVLILVWPDKSALVLTTIVAVYAIAAGLLYFSLTVTDRGRSGWSRIGHGAIGLVFVLAGILAFLNPAPAAASFAVVVVIFIGIGWIAEGIVAFSTLVRARVSGWTIFYAVISVLAGIALLVSPLLGAIVLWVWVGISLLVLGLLQVLRALSLRRESVS